ncbi:hypothetical protein AVI51_11520 [Piscirickettsia salmonis]|uniref:XRE family transcriptional regulator n=1 Tax=Piscirickettsia salmonis TaxID=1238 RepID=A0A095BL42_PISSA|nr:hypothetical protein [Piscirickettsia salmonis]PRP61335.1 hypothetical protein C7B72_22590 [Bacillus halotolerans]RNC79087.1 hypothetical protein DA717_00870 [Piscirickettsiaceae bacterium NZ-RLO2]ALA26358.1 XRE family transcriptional regulator [Piscirickettsia salmonis]ALB21365.1 XRE family transcriptional regulator [Piscirickettsia salmonis]ALT18077.1 hypothetical protein PSLF89_03645 [Piscirickettsia salmonis LF-89 = ATCC VR-1361]
MDAVLDDWFWDYKKGQIVLRNESGDISVETKVSIRREDWSWPYPVDSEEWSRVCVGCFRMHGKIANSTLQKWLHSEEGERLIRRLVAQQKFG